MNTTRTEVYQITTRYPVIAGRCFTVWVIEKTRKLGEEGVEFASTLVLDVAVAMAVDLNMAARAKAVR